MLSNSNKQTRMEQIDQELQQLLSDKDKQGHVEIKIIKRLHKLDTNKAFYYDFHSVLESCKITRTPNKEEGQIYQYTTLHHNYQITKEKFSDTKSIVQYALARDFVQLVTALIENLYNLSNQTEALMMIQELNKMSLEQDFYENYPILFEHINQTFYQSKRLLAVTLAPQIIDQYVLTLGSPSHPTILSFQSIGEKEDKKEQCKFSVDEQEFICEFSNKAEGKFFGSIVQIKAKDGSKARTYYLKANKGYPATNKKGNKDSIEDTISFSSTFESIPDKEKPVEKYHYIDLREPFMYKVLEHLGYGAKTYIMMNPYILYGLFIITEDLNSGPNEFCTIDTLSSKIDLGTILHLDIEDLAPAKNLISNQFTEVSILSSIFNLCDLHVHNWGYLATNETYNQLREGKESSLRPQIRIIDFLLPNGTRTKIPLEEQFLSGKIPGMDLDLFNIHDDFLINLFALPKLIKKRQEEIKNTFDSRINQGKAANQQFHVNLRGRLFLDILERTKAKLLKEITQYPLLLSVIKPDEQSLLSLNGNPYIELMKYCSEIEGNYGNWQTFIAEGYQQWLNKKLETAKQK